MVVVALGAPVVASAAAGDPEPDRTGATQLVALVNQERASAGLPAVVLSNVAIEVAEAWSVHMAATSELAHNDAWFTPESKDRALAKTVGENVAFNVDLADAHQRLMNSPQHRANILNPRFHQIGVGTVRGATGSWWVTEDFVELRPVADAAEAVPPPAAAPAPASPPAAPAPAPAPGPAPASSPAPVPAGDGRTGPRVGAPAEADPPVDAIAPAAAVSTDAAGDAAATESASGAALRAGPSTSGAGEPLLLAALVAFLFLAADLFALRKAVLRQRWQDRSA